MFVSILLTLFFAVIIGFFLFPLPINKSGTVFKQVTDGRMTADTTNSFDSATESICSTNCEADFTCKAYSTWSGAPAKGSVNCKKYTNTINPWLTFPAWFKNVSNAKIFLKN